MTTNDHPDSLAAAAANFLDWWDTHKGIKHGDVEALRAALAAHREGSTAPGDTFEIIEDGGSFEVQRTSSTPHRVVSLDSVHATLGGARTRLAELRGDLPADTPEQLMRYAPAHCSRCGHEHAEGRPCLDQLVEGTEFEGRFPPEGGQPTDDTLAWLSDTLADRGAFEDDDTITVPAGLLRRLERELAEAREALRFIDRYGCTNYTRGRCLDDSSRSKDAKYSAEAWCDACVAADVLVVRPVEDQEETDGD